MRIRSNMLIYYGTFRLISARTHRAFRASAMDAGAQPLAPRDPRRQPERLRLSFDKVTMPISIKDASRRMTEIIE
jgi:hypothetical protein